MSEEYFNNHIFPYRSETHTWLEGEGFLISYQVKIGWMLYDASDHFTIKIDSELYPSLTAPRGVYLNDSVITQLITDNQFGDVMHIIAPIEQLKYSSQKKAIKAMRDQAGNNTIKFTDYYYGTVEDKITPNGHPYMKGFGTIDYSENKCISVKIDLVTGDCEINDCACYIIRQ